VPSSVIQSDGMFGSNCRDQLWLLKNSDFRESAQILGIENVYATRENRL
jgi:hypothetical protein